MLKTVTPFLKWNINITIPVAGLGYAHVHMSVRYIYYDDISKNHLSKSYPVTKHSKQSKLKVSCIRKKETSDFLVLTEWDVTFALCNNLACLGFFAKVLFPF